MVYIPFRVSATYQFIHWYIYHSGISIMSSQGGIHTTARLNQKVVYIQLRILLVHIPVYTIRILLVHIPLGLAWVLKVVYIPFRLSRTHQFSHWYIYQSELKQNTSIKWYIYHFYSRCKSGICTILGITNPSDHSPLYIRLWASG